MKKLFNALALLVIAMFVLSMFTGIVVADAREKEHEKKHEHEEEHEYEKKEHRFEKFEDIKERHEKLKKRYEKAKENFEEAKERYIHAKRAFWSLKNRPSKDKLINRTREYLENAVNLMINHLEVVKDRLEEINETIPFNASANIDEHIANLEDIQKIIQSADTPQELSDAAKQLKDEWVNIKLESMYYMGMAINHAIDNFLTKSDNVSVRMNNTIEELKDEGKDTSELEEIAMNFNNLLNEARDSYEQALELYDIHEGFDSKGMVVDSKEALSFLREAHKLQKETHKKLKEASKELRSFFREVKKLRHGVVFKRGTGTLEASGNGSAIIIGNLTATISGNGTLIVSGNSQVTTSGTGRKNQLGNGDVKYQGFGLVNITGDNVRIRVSGNNISLTVTGTGYALLHGNGTYSTTGNFSVSGEWREE